MPTPKITVGDFLPYESVPDGSELFVVFTQAGLNAIATALGMQANTFSAALINTRGEKYETVWLCKDARPFEMTAAYCLFKHKQQIAA